MRQYSGYNRNDDLFFCDIIFEPGKHSFTLPKFDSTDPRWVHRTIVPFLSEDYAGKKDSGIIEGTIKIALGEGYTLGTILYEWDPINGVHYDYIHTQMILWWWSYILSER